MKLNLKTLLSISFITCSTAAIANESSIMGNSNFSSMIFFTLIFGFMYFFVIRPQNKKTAAQQNLLKSLTIGDEVLLQSGIVGKIFKESNNLLVIKSGNDSELVIQKQYVSQLLPKGTLKLI